MGLGARAIRWKVGFNEREEDVGRRLSAVRRVALRFSSFHRSFFSFVELRLRTQLHLLDLASTLLSLGSLALFSPHS